MCLCICRCGKTEIARRLAKLAEAPFIKVGQAAAEVPLSYVGWTSTWPAHRHDMLPLYDLKGTFHFH